MSNLRVQFLAFDGCPLADTARGNLENALEECGISEYETIDILDPATPEELRGWGSPTILVNGIDISGHAKGDSVGCRVYSEPEKVPSAATIIESIRSVKATRL